MIFSSWVVPKRSFFILSSPTVIFVSLLSTSGAYLFRSSTRLSVRPHRVVGRNTPIQRVAAGQRTRVATLTSSSDDDLMIAAPELVVSLRDYLQSKNDDYDSNKIRLVLASQSPRRKEILDMMGLQGKFEVAPSPLDESALQKELQSTDPVNYTRILAEQKAMALARQSVQSPSDHSVGAKLLVLGSDTIVAYGGSILEKPVDEADAVRMLNQLQGNRHTVHTGVALVLMDDNNDVRLIESFTETATVQFAALTESDIAAYVASGEPMDKAGSYGIQGIGGQLVTSIEGDFFTVSSARFVSRDRTSYL